MGEPVILCIETSGKYCSVALSRGVELLAESESNDEYDHSAMLALHIQDVLSQSKLGFDQVNAVALSSGPGSYTGLRVGASTAKAICYASGIELIAISTLEAIASEAMERSPDSDLYFPVMDARRMEVYVAAFDKSGQRLLHDMALEVTESTFSRLISAGEKIAICGPAATKCSRFLAGLEASNVLFEMHARYLVRPAVKQYFRGQFADNVMFTPKYIKAPNITKSTKRPF